MRALILAGGFGKRLMPMTKTIPKALVKVGGKPIIYWQIKWLTSFGINDFVILGGYKADKLVQYIKSIGYSDSFEFSIENTPLGSAGALRNARNLLQDDEKFLVINGDNITNIDVNKLRLPDKTLCCISLIPYRSRSGLARIQKNLVVSFEEKPLIKDYWNNAGITLVSRELLKILPAEGSLEYEVFPSLVKKRKLACTTFSNNYFRAVDTFKDYEDIDGDLKSKRVKI